MLDGGITYKNTQYNLRLKSLESETLLKVSLVSTVSCICEQNRASDSLAVMAFTGFLMILLA